MRKGELTTKPGDVRLIIHEPIATQASPEPDMRQVRALAQRVREVLRPPVEEEATNSMTIEAVPGRS
jgi:hypothetical protein